jgi:hypothetical protein
MESLMIYTPRLIFFGRSNREERDWGGGFSTYGERNGVYRVLVLKRGRKNHLEDPREGGRIILSWIFRNGVGAWTG